MAEPVIVIDPEIIGGTPCFRGTRVPFKNLIDYLEGGHSRSEGIITSQDRVKILLDECLPLNLRHGHGPHQPARKLTPLANQISAVLGTIERGQVVRVPK